MQAVLKGQEATGERWQVVVLPYFDLNRNPGQERLVATQRLEADLHGNTLRRLCENRRSGTLGEQCPDHVDHRSFGFRKRQRVILTVAPTWILPIFVSSKLAMTQRDSRLFTERIVCPGWTSLHRRFDPRTLDRLGERSECPFLTIERRVQPDCLLVI
jgi:hypothetical protein